MIDTEFKPGRRFAVVLAAMVGLGYAGTAWSQDLPGPAGATPAPSSPPGMTAAALPKIDADEHYQLGAGDKVKVTVYGEDDLSGEFSVDSTGQVQLPLVGQVKAAGLTVREFTDEVRTVLAGGYLKSPKVSVEVLNYRPFYIMGQVNRPGEYPYESGLTVRAAVALAGGFTYRANDSIVRLLHKGDSKDAEVPADATVKINPGDVITVRERLF